MKLREWFKRKFLKSPIKVIEKIYYVYLNITINMLLKINMIENKSKNI